MTDRYNSLIVVLENNIREDDAQSTINAIRHIKGVIAVEGNISDIGHFVASSRIRRELGEKIWDVIYPKIKE